VWPSALGRVGDGLVDHHEHVGQPADLEETDHGAARALEDETAASADAFLVSFDEHAKAAGVDEVDRRHVDHQVVGGVARQQAPEFSFEQGRGVGVELAAQCQPTRRVADVQAGTWVNHGSGA
jgi:hypothetical protein